MLLLLLLVTQFGLQQALLYKIIVVETTSHPDASFLVVPMQLHELLSLHRFFVEHLGVEERADVLVITFQAFQNQ